MNLYIALLFAILFEVTGTMLLPLTKEFSKIRDLESKVLNSRNKISNNFSTEKISKDLIMVYEKL